MNWEALGAVAELLGALAVLATIGYLTIQVRQNSVVMREQAQYHMLQNQIGYFDRLAGDRDFVRTAYGRDLTDDEVADRQHEAHVVALLFKWNWEFLRVKDGVYPIDAIPVEGFRWQFATAGMGRHWQERKAALDPDFVAFMERDIIPFAD